MPNVTPQGRIGAAQLKEYWAHGKGREKWIHSPHPYTELMNQLRRVVPAKVDVPGLAGNIFKLATGHYPGQRKDGERL